MRLWSDLCKGDIIIKPKEDVCGACSDPQSRISTESANGRGLSEVQRCSEGHIIQANIPRDNYRHCVQRGKMPSAVVTQIELLIVSILTFDFAQNATMPIYFPVLFSWRGVSVRLVGIG